MKTFFSPTDFFRVLYHHCSTRGNPIDCPNSRKRCWTMWVTTDPSIRKNWKLPSDPYELGMAGVLFQSHQEGSGEAASLWSSPHRQQKKWNTPLSTSAGNNARPISQKALSSSRPVNCSILFSRRREDSEPSTQLSQTHRTQSIGT